jgi:hypothetical protein
MSRFSREDYASHFGPIMPDEGLPLLRRRDLFSPAGRQMPIGPVPGDIVVVLAATEDWGEGTEEVGEVLNYPPEHGSWVVRTEMGDEMCIERGADGRWWSYGALHGMGEL